MMLRSSSTLLSAANLAAVLFFSALCFGQSKTETAPPKQVTGAITGRVLNSSGDPLPGAFVFAASVGSGRRSQSVKADKNGDFKIDGLPAGVYRVSPSMAGYVPSPQSAFNSQNFYHIGDWVNLTMNKGGVITGKVTGLNGPLIAVGVFAIRVRDENGKRLPTSPFSRERATDDRGVYRIYGLLPGSYLVMSAKPRLGLIAASAYDDDTPTYFPSSPRDTASEIIVREGEEITADIQYRAEPGHVISGQVLGIVESQLQFSANASITLIDVRNGSAVFSTGATSYDNFGFAFSGVPNGEYELSAAQFLQSRDELRSPPRSVTVRDADMTGVTLTLTRQGAIEGRLIFASDAKPGCGKRRETAAQETVVYGRRYVPKETNDGPPNRPTSDASILASNYVSLDVGDATGTFTLRNLPPGTYHIDPHPPASGWFLRSITLGPTPTVAARNAVSRDGVNLKSGERLSGLIVTMTEGAASIRGRVTAPEGQRLPTRISVYLVPTEKVSAADVLQFFETRAESDGAFVIGNIAPGKYWIVARENEALKTAGNEKHIRRDAELRSTVSREAEKIKKEISFKPCERVTDYELPLQR